jgi:hypothetical protein
LLQAYVRRWEIEATFREEKQLIGRGEENFEDFVKARTHDLKPLKSNPHLASAVLYASA